MNRIRFLRLKHGLKQEDFARKIQVSQSSLSGYENEKFEPDYKTLLKIADYFGVSADYLLGKSPSPKTGRPCKRIPVYNHIGSSLKRELPFMIYCQEDQGLLDSGDYFGLSVEFDCMEPRIRPGDVLIVRRQKEIRSGDVAVVQIGSGDAAVRKVLFGKDGAMVLISYNVKYEPQIFTAEQIVGLPVRILGKVVEFRGKC